MAKELFDLNFACDLDLGHTDLDLIRDSSSRCDVHLYNNLAKDLKGTRNQFSYSAFASDFDLKIRTCAIYATRRLVIVGTDRYICTLFVRLCFRCVGFKLR